MEPTTNVHTSDDKVLTMATLNPNVKAMQYAVRGPTVTRSYELVKELEQGETTYPFSRVVHASSGDCQASGQRSLTFARQVIALCTCPEVLMESPEFPEDAKLRARRILDSCRGHSIGSYSASQGVQVVREDIAAYIAERDGFPSNPDDINLSTGASDAIRSVMTMLMTGRPGTGKLGVMIPVPPYPLYSVILAEMDARPIHYFLDEEAGWALDIRELRRALHESRGHCQPRAIVVINPGNPTGQVLSKQNIQDIIKFAYEEKLFIMADEVYQHNVSDPSCQFHSFKKVMMEMGAPYSTMELASFMSASKGYMGECGFRGGYSEVINLDPEVRQQFYKLLTGRICPPISGQIVLDVMANPPRPGEPSHEQFQRERAEILSQHARKARLVSQMFNAIEGITCNPVQGALYAFPRIHLPPRAVEAAMARGQTPDTHYCFRLLEETGISTVPGCGFGEKPGTYHFRTTILPPLEQFQEVFDLFKKFHLNFLREHGYFDSESQKPADQTEEVGGKLGRDLTISSSLQPALQQHATKEKSA